MTPVDQVLLERHRDGHLILFRTSSPARAAGVTGARRNHFAWFATNGLAVEAVAPTGWLDGLLEGHMVHFGGPDDPRVAAYIARFEGAGGRSLKPDVYQMVRLRSVSPSN